jgi:hypothetical protein
MSDYSIRKAGAAAALVASGLAAGAVLASSMTANAASGGSTSTPSSSTSSTAPRHSSDTAVTGTTADKVKAAVEAKYSNVKITTVRKDADGSYDALGTDASGNPVFYDVSADLATITAGGGGMGHGGGPGGIQDTPVTGTAASNVKAAVTAAHSGVTITTVRKDPDGSYDALGTDSSGNQVFYDVSADLKTITANAGHARGYGGAPNGAPSSTTTTG